MPKEVPKRRFQPKADFSTVIGDKKLKFLQGGVYYDAHHRPVKMAPKRSQYFSDTERKKDFKDKLKQKEKITPMDTKSFNSPDSVISAEKENQLAVLAENFAE